MKYFSVQAKEKEVWKTLASATPLLAKELFIFQVRKLRVVVEETLDKPLIAHVALYNV